MSFTNSTPIAGPFGCALPGFVPSFSPAFVPAWSPNFGHSFGPNFSHSGSQHFAPTFASRTPNTAVPFNWFAPSHEFAGFNNSPSPYGWNPTPWFSNPVWHNSFGSTSPSCSANSVASNDPSWFSNSYANNPAWFSHFAPAHATNEFPNAAFAAQPSWPAYGWNQNCSFSPLNPSFASATSTTPWFANPNFYQPTNAAHYQTFTPWFSPAFGGSSWFTPHNGTNSPVNPAWAQPGAPAPNSSHANPTPYAVATPPNATAARDAA